MHTALLSAALHLDLEVAATSALPTEFRIFRAGVNKARSNEGGHVDYLFDDEAARRVMADAEEYGNDFSLDYNHGAFAMLALDPAESGKSAGWYSLELRKGELWAVNVRWTPKAAEQLSQKEWRFVSPAFSHVAATGRITRLMNVALTNTPRLVKQDALVAASQTATLPAAPPPPPEKSMELKNLIALLSLGAQSSEQDVLTALASMQQVQAQSKELLALCGASSMSEAIGRVRGLQEKAARTDALEAQVAAAAESAKKAELNAVLEKAVADKKVAPAQVAFLSQMGERDIEQLKGYLATLSPLVATAPTKEPTGGSTGVALLSQAEQFIAQKMGLDPVKFAEHKAKLGHVHEGVRVAATPEKAS